MGGGSGDDLMLDDILVIEDFGDDQEPDIILDDLLATSEEEVSSKVLKNESTGIDSIENESAEGVSQGDVPVSKEEEDVITPLKGIKTILVVTTNPDVELPENSPEEKVNSEEFLVEEDKD